MAKGSENEKSSPVLLWAMLLGLYWETVWRAASWACFASTSRPYSRIKNILKHTKALEGNQILLGRSHEALGTRSGAGEIR